MVSMKASPVSEKEEEEPAGSCNEDREEEEDSYKERMSEPSPKDNIATSSPAEDSEFDRSLKSAQSSPNSQSRACETSNQPQEDTSESKLEEKATVELRFLVRRREAGALIGKKGCNIKRLREAFRSSIFSIPDTGNGPERVVCIVTDEKSIDAILTDFTQLLMEKSPENDEQIELKLLIHSSHAGSIIGIGGQSIKKLRNDSKAAIKIYEMCCPLSNERVCAIKAKPAVVVKTIRLIQSIFNENPIKGTIKPYDALNFDLNLIEKYGGYSLEDLPLDFGQAPFPHHHNQRHHNPHHANHQNQHPHHRQPYPAYLGRLAGRQQLAFEASHRLQLEKEPPPGRAAEMALAKGYLSTGQNFSIWRATDCPLEVSPESLLLASAQLPELEPSSNSPGSLLSSEPKESPKLPPASALNQRLLMLKPRFHSAFQQNGKPANLGPINNHNVALSRLNPYARSYPRNNRGQPFPPPANNNYQNQQQQRHFQRHFEGQQQQQQADEAAQVELLDPTGSGRQQPYLCMFYPSLACHQAPFRPLSPAASLLVRGPRLETSQQLAVAQQANWPLHQIHYIQAQHPVVQTSNNNKTAESTTTGAGGETPPPSTSSPGSKRSNQ